MKFLDLSHIAFSFVLFLQTIALLSSGNAGPPHRHGRECVSINSGWEFKRWEANPDGVIYDQRPDLENLTDVTSLKPWIMPSGNDFIEDVARRHGIPGERPDIDVEYARNDFDDKSWMSVNTPHDWGISGPFYKTPDNEFIVGGGMGRLPIFGVGWY